jgi:epoxyqueuosine reductase QueG
MLLFQVTFQNQEIERQMKRIGKRHWLMNRVIELGQKAHLFDITRLVKNTIGPVITTAMRRSKMI